MRSASGSPLPRARRTQGVEAEASLVPTDSLPVTVAYIHTDGEDRVTGQPLRRFAPHRFAALGTMSWPASGPHSEVAVGR